MGLIKAVVSAASSSLKDTWKDYFVCESSPDEVLMIKGTKKGSSSLFGNNSDVITNGSGIVVADGQCALIVDDGIVVEVANEPGNYTFSTDKSPSIFDGGFKGLKDTFNQMVERFTYGGETNRSQAVYYVNTKEVMGNMYGTATPIPFRFKDGGIDMDVSLRCNGEYSIRVTNPILFYKNVAGNVTQYEKSKLDNQLKTELLTALQPALAGLSSKGVGRYSDIPLHTLELVDELNGILSNKWSELRGISIVSFGINSITPTDDDLKRIQNLQEGASLKDANMAAGVLAAAKAQAMRDAANNSAGAATGFMGVNMTGTSSDIASLYASGAANNNANASASSFCPYCGKPISVADAAFCPSCGKPLK